MANPQSQAPKAKPSTAAAPEKPAALELYKLARAQVEHENTLVGQRITWYLTLQGFLLTATFVTAANLLAPTNQGMHATARLNLAIAIGLLCFLGVGSSVACCLLIRAAYAHINRVVAWWHCEPTRVSQFPELTGTGGFQLFRYRVSGADFVLVILLTWLALLGLMVHAALEGA